jgi:hypothetical protein
MGKKIASNVILWAQFVNSVMIQQTFLFEALDAFLTNAYPNKMGAQAVQQV